MTFLSAAVAIAAGLGAFAFWLFQWLFRPIRPKLSTREIADILATSSDDHLQDITIEVVSTLDPKELEIIQTAFLKGPDFRWMAAGKNMDNIMDKKLAEDHKKLTFYMIQCMLVYVEMYGTILVARDKETGKFLGSVSVSPPYEKMWLYRLHFLSSVIPMGNPVPRVIGGDTAARFEAWNTGYDELKKKAKQANGGKPHWVAEVLAVADDVQGRGIGRKLMSVVKVIVDHDDQTSATFLACHDGNLPFYGKMGFTRASRVTFEPKSKTDPTTFSYNGMMYGT